MQKTLADAPETPQNNTFPAQVYARTQKFSGTFGGEVENRTWVDVERHKMRHFTYKLPLDVPKRYAPSPNPCSCAEVFMDRGRGYGKPASSGIETPHFEAFSGISTNKATQPGAVRSLMKKRALAETLQFNHRLVLQSCKIQPSSITKTTSARLSVITLLSVRVGPPGRG